ncbi:Phenylacetone monooxygenase [Favolaschia claudopus]|uniref:Phenylacetone monooxygenase n=1 Tax=Favolaschia claudopus TaxID=2862362 RepID=A0AAW0D862_9AGAR
MNVGPGVAVPDEAIRQKYIDERNKRVRSDGLNQFLKVTDSDKYKYLDDDPWVDHESLNRASPAIADGDEVKFLIVGAGFGGLLFAVQLIEAGFSAADIRLVDSAGGFGGTWYSNRYPGLMCDIESYIYVPLLEETGYMPKHRYSYGAEIREHTERIAAHWGITDNALFRAHCHSAQWDDSAKRWNVHLTENRGPIEAPKEVHVKAQYVLLASGAFNIPQIPRLPGFAQFNGQHFHTSRWNYDITGGSQADWTLDKLKDKSVGIIGTGATGVQVVPQLAKWARHLYVFQRTPASVDVRGQRPTDLDEWNKITAARGWQRIRSENFNTRLVNTPVGENLVDDSLTHIPSYSAVMGTPGIISPDKLPEHIAKLHAHDLERSERIRARTSEVVKDPTTADKLKHWYPAWCKRPTFHDDYLPTFNLPNVTLVDSDGKGPDAVTEGAIIVDGVPYPIDVLVLSTGYSLAVEGSSGSPAQRANGMKVAGRDGLDMDELWLKEGAGTLHGVASHGFPNLFVTGIVQTGVSANFTFTLMLLTSSIAKTLAAAERRVVPSNRVTVEVTKAAQDEWVAEVLKRSNRLAVMRACTPSYFNGQGAIDRITDPQKQMKASRGTTWGEGVVNFTELLTAWQEEGELRGYEVNTNM